MAPLVRAGFRVIAVDNSGHGRSSTPPTGLSYRDFAADLAELIEYLALPPVVAIGHSMGGFIVKPLSAEWGSAVRAIVSVDAGYGLPEDGEYQSLHYAGKLLDLLKAADGVAQVAAVAFPAEWSDTAYEGLKTWRRRKFVATDHAVLVEGMSAMFNANSIGSRERAAEYFSRTTCPVLAIHTRSSQVAWEETTFNHPYSRSVHWGDSGHVLHQERIDDFNQLLMSWLSEVS